MFFTKISDDDDNNNTAFVVWWSEFLATNSEVSGSIAGATRLSDK
jgi:hypothetical protein